MLRAGQGNGRDTQGVGPSHCKQGNGQYGKGFGAKTITHRTASKAAEEGERDQDAGSKPGRGKDADRRRMGSERHPVGEREEREVSIGKQSGPRIGIE